MKKIASILCAAFLPGALFGSALPADRVIPWDLTGVEGGIPNRTTISTTVANTGTPAALLAAINSAIAAAAPDTVVKLNAGTYNVTGPLQLRRSNVVLRGSFDSNGVPTTNIHFTATQQTNHPTVVIISLPTGPPCVACTPNPPIPNLTDWTAGYTQGATQVTLTSAAGLSPGDTLVLDQKNDVSLGVTSVGNEGCSYCSRDGQGRLQQQRTGVMSVAGNVVTIKPGLYLGNYSTASQPQAWWFPTIKWVGIEDVTLDFTDVPPVTGCPNVPGCDTVGVAYQGAANCWAKNVYSIKSGWAHHETYDARNITWQHCRMYDVKSGGFSQSYGILMLYASACRVENNVGRHVSSPAMTGAGSSGCAILYNYGVDMVYTGTWMQAFGSQHAAHSYMHLWEGNVANDIYADFIHGSGSNAVMLRNRLYGWESGKTDNLHAIVLESHQRNSSAVGNVLGTEGVHQFLDELNQNSTWNKTIYKIGFPGTFDNTAIDNLTRTTFIRHGNYDFVTHSQIFDGSNSDHVMPKSYVYGNTAPAYFGNLPWPPVDPSTPTTTAPASIPAGFRESGNGSDPPTGPTPTPTPTPGALVPDQASLDWGTVEVGSSPPDKPVVFTNPGTTTVSGVLNVASPLSIVDVSGTSYSLGPGASLTKTFRYRPTATANYSYKITNTGSGGSIGIAVLAQAYPLLTSPMSAGDGLIIAPFAVSSGVVSQTIETVIPQQSGRALYGFNITTAGNYLIEIEADAAAGDRDSIFASVDAVPVDPGNISSVLPLTTGFEWRALNEQGTSLAEPQFMPKVFTLTAGHHLLYLYGREANTLIKTIRTTSLTGPTPTPTPTPAAPTIITQPTDQTVVAGQTATFSVTATGGAPLAYQWQISFTGDIFGMADIPGAIGATYVTPPTVSGDDRNLYQCIVSNVTGSDTSNAATLRVNIAPAVVTNAATNINTTTATLNGTVNPEGQSTTYHFEYGPTTSYGTSTATTSAGSSFSVLPKTAFVSGLTPATTTHYRITATNATGTSNGSDVAFTTAATPTPTPTPTPIPSPPPPPKLRIYGGTFTHNRNSFWNLNYFKPFWLTFSKIEKVPADAGTSSLVTDTYHDRVYYVSTVPKLNDFLWRYTYELDRPITTVVSRSSSNDALITPLASDPFRWTSHTVGSATLTVTTPYQTQNNNIDTGTLQIQSTFHHFIPGSAAEQVANTIDTAIQGLAANDTTMKLFSTYSPPDTFVRNTSLWAPWDFTCFSAWNSLGWGGGGGPQRAGTLVSPRDVICVNHFLLFVGTVMKFVQADNTTVTRTVINKLFVPGTNDTVVCLLDSDVPAGITFAKVLPQKWHEKLFAPSSKFDPLGFIVDESLTRPWPVPIVQMNQFREVSLLDVSTMSSEVDTGFPGGVTAYQSTNPQRQLFYKEGIAGDSGSPVFMIINGEPVFLQMLGGFSQGLRDNFDRINAVMAQLGSGYQLTEISLGSFPSF